MADARPDPIPPKGVDLQHPSPARIYDYFLGGTANWAIDQRIGDQVIKEFPLIRDIAVANRMFLGRVVRQLTKLGVRQFLDIGAGVPTAGNTHQVADRLSTDTRVVYVDNDPVAVGHGENLLDQEGDPERHAVIEADLRNPDHLWEKALATGLLDPQEPIALLVIAVLHLRQPDPAGNEIGPSCLARYRQLLPSGSYLGISHATDDGVPDELEPSLTAIKQMYGRASGGGGAVWRSRAEIAALFGDFELVEPGMVWTPQWHPEEAAADTMRFTFQTPSHAVVWAGVGRKPG